MFPNITLEKLWSRREVLLMSFDSLTQQAMQLNEPNQAKMLFYLLGNLNGYFKFDFDQAKTLNKQQVLTLINDSLQAVI